MCNLDYSTAVTEIVEIAPRAEQSREAFLQWGPYVAHIGWIAGAVTSDPGGAAWWQQREARRLHKIATSYRAIRNRRARAVRRSVLPLWRRNDVIACGGVE